MARADGDLRLCLALLGRWTLILDLDFRKVVDVTVAGRPIPTGANLSPGKITRRVPARVAGFRIKGSGVFTEFIPNQRIRDMTSPSFEGSWAYLFQAEDSGMRLTLEHFPGSFGRIPLLGRLAERLGSKGHARVLSKLKARMEA
ncbi:MAG: hypothetical protein ACM3ML_25635 [Micromonosporaceae bacterium]